MIDYKVSGTSSLYTLNLSKIDYRPHKRETRRVDHVTQSLRGRSDTKCQTLTGSNCSPIFTTRLSEYPKRLRDKKNDLYIV